VKSKRFWTKEFGERLNEERLRYCMTETEMAERIGVSVARYLEFERGETCPSAYTLYKLTKVFTSVDFLRR